MVQTGSLELREGAWVEKRAAMIGNAEQDNWLPVFGFLRYLHQTPEENPSPP
jgi:hypothetical protein